MKCARLVIAFAALAGLLAGNAAGSERQGKPWHDDESAAFAAARKSGRHVVVVFGADWCLPCKTIDEIMNGDIVYGLMTESFVPLHFDLSDLSESHEVLQAKYRVPGLPAVIFVDVAGRELRRWDQNLSAGGFIGAMRAVLASHPLPSAATPR